jgi:signal transduction histidine kinase/Flp pilus assembly protein TadD
LYYFFFVDSLKMALSLPTSDYSNYGIRFLKFGILIILLSVPFSGIGQNRFDSLLNKVNETEDSDKAPIYMELFIVSMNDYDRALFYAEQAQNFALLAGDSLTYVRAEYAIAFLYKGQGLYEEAIEHYKLALQTAQNNGYNDREKSILNGLALSYYYASQFDKSLEYHFKSLALREKEGNQKEIALSANNIGLVYYQINDFHKAMLYFNLAKKIEEEQNSESLVGTYVNLGLAQMGLNDFDVALENFNKALVICELGCNDLIKVEALNGAGACLLELRLFNDAEDKLDSAYLLAKEKGLEVKLIAICNNLARLSIINSDFSKALEMLNLGQNLSNKLKIRSWSKKNFKLFAEVFYRTGDYQKAYEYQMEYDSVSSEILNEVVAKNLLQIQVDFEERQNLEIIELQNEIIGRRTIFLILALIISLLTAFIVIILYRNNKLRKRVNKKLMIANKTIEKQNSKLTDLNLALEDRVKERTEELRATNKALTKSNNDLDNFIYKTSHDIRGPLATLQGVCNIALMDIKEVVAVDYFEKLSRTASKLNQILSKLLVINQINNSSPSDDIVLLNDLINTIVDENRELHRGKEIIISNNIPLQLKVTVDALLIKIILGNLINNAFKFHNTSSKIQSVIMINGFVKNKELLLTVTDNGVGINENIAGQIFDIFSKTSEVQDTAGLGLYLVKLALDRLEGVVSVEKTIEDYTQFKVIIPLT